MYSIKPKLMNDKLLGPLKSQSQVVSTSQSWLKFGDRNSCSWTYKIRKFDEPEAIHIFAEP